MLSCHLTSAQSKKKLPVTFQLSYGNEPLLLTDKVYSLPNGNTFKLQTFRFYISGIALYNKGALQWKEKNSFHLLDASQPQSLNLSFDLPDETIFDSVKFHLGIDSLTNVSGALGGDLDPSKGMYWSWQSGYINFKLEGSSPACPTRNNEFQFHLGGYATPFASLQEISLATNNTRRITVSFDLKKFLETIDLSTTNSIMIPCPDAVTLSRQAATIFSIRQ